MEESAAAAAAAATPLKFQKVESIQGTEDREYVLIDTADACREALAVLKTSPVVAVDCEGRDLSRAGTLALVQVSNERNQCFIFDLVPGDNFTVFFDLGLRALLESADVMKVMHDCRNDADALSHLAHVTLHNVVDTQIAQALHKIAAQNSLPFPTGYAKLVQFGLSHTRTRATRNTAMGGTVLDVLVCFFLKNPFWVDTTE